MTGELIQGAAVGVIVLGAVASMARRGWKVVSTARSTPEEGSCGGGCGCGKS